MVNLKYVSSPLEHIPYVGQLQAKFDFPSARLWLYNSWPYTIPLCLLYVLLVFTGQRWMSSRQPYHLRRPLFIWNLFLALFSACGTISLVPHLFDILYKSGLKESVCITEALYNPHISIWCFLFVLSKVVELGDTAFVVLRKTPLQFLHWYHHITVLVYASYGLGRPISSPIGIWFGSMNYSVHSVMYTYYAIKAAGYHVPSKVSQCITIFQLSQMIVALIVNWTSYRSYLLGETCDIDVGVFYVGMVIYGSYALLFARFFYKRFINPQPLKAKKE